MICLAQLNVLCLDASRRTTYLSQMGRPGRSSLRPGTTVPRPPCRNSFPPPALHHQTFALILPPQMAATAIPTIPLATAVVPYKLAGEALGTIQGPQHLFCRYY